MARTQMPPPSSSYTAPLAQPSTSATDNAQAVVLRTAPPPPAPPTPATREQRNKTLRNKAILHTAQFVLNTAVVSGVRHQALHATGGNLTRAYLSGEAVLAAMEAFIYRPADKLGRHHLKLMPAPEGNLYSVPERIRSGIAGMGELLAVLGASLITGYVFETVTRNQTNKEYADHLQKHFDTTLGIVATAMAFKFVANVLPHVYTRFSATATYQEKSPKQQWKDAAETAGLVAVKHYKSLKDFRKAPSDTIKTALNFTLREGINVAGNTWPLATAKMRPGLAVVEAGPLNSLVMMLGKASRGVVEDWITKRLKIEESATSDIEMGGSETGRVIEELPDDSDEGSPPAAESSSKKKTPAEPETPPQQLGESSNTGNGQPANETDDTDKIEKLPPLHQEVGSTSVSKESSKEKAPAPTETPTKPIAESSNTVSHQPADETDKAKKTEEPLTFPLPPVQEHEDKSLSSPVQQSKDGGSRDIDQSLTVTTSLATEDKTGNESSSVSQEKMQPGSPVSKQALPAIDDVTQDIPTFTTRRSQQQKNEGSLLSELLDQPSSSGTNPVQSSGRAAAMPMSAPLREDVISVIAPAPRQETRQPDTGRSENRPSVAPQNVRDLRRNSAPRPSSAASENATEHSADNVKERKDQKRKGWMNRMTAGKFYRSYAIGSGKPGDYKTNERMKQQISTLQQQLDNMTVDAADADRTAQVNALKTQLDTALNRIGKDTSGEMVQALNDAVRLLTTPAPADTTATATPSAFQLPSLDSFDRGESLDTLFAEFKAKPTDSGQ